MVPLWPTAALPFGVQRSRAFQLAHRGEFPVEVLRIGGRWMVRTSDLRRQLGLQVYKTASVTHDEIVAAVRAHIDAEEAEGLPRTVDDPEILAGLGRILEDAARIKPSH